MGSAKAGRGDKLKQVRIAVARVRCEDESFTADDERIIKSLMDSIPRVGLLNPITVQQFPSARESYRLTAGRKRLQAYKRLGIKIIPARVEQGQSLETRDWSELARIDENLVRGEMGAAARTKSMLERKRVYELANPDVAGRKAEGRAPASRRSKTFAQDTAERTGLNPATVRNTVTRARRLGQAALGEIAGTSLDSEAELEAIVMLPKEKRDALIERAAKGEQVSARANRPQKRTGANKSAQHDIDIKAFAAGADDARHQGDDALDTLKARDYGDKDLERFATATGKVLAIWNRVAEQIAKQRE